MELYQRIKHRREELGLSQAELAERIGYGDRSTIAKIEKGVNDLTQSKIEAFASALRTTPAYLMGWTDDPYDFDTDEDGLLDTIPSDQFEELSRIYKGSPARIWAAWEQSQNDFGKASLPQNVIPIPRMNEVPLIGSIACGTPILAAQNVEDQVSTPEFIHADFALRCKGDSMIDARIHDGDIVYIRQQQTVDSGEIAAVLIGEEATLKRVYLSPGTVVLQPANPRYEPMVYSGSQLEQVRILGKAVGFTSTIML